jgi:hypothetical protein
VPDLSGSYTATLTKDQMIATGLAAGFARADLEGLLAVEGVEAKADVTVKLADGGWTQLVAYDGTPTKVASRGAYRVVDDHTVIDADECEITYHYALTGEQLALEIADDHTCSDYGERMAVAMFYETAPLQKVEEDAAPSSAAAAFTTHAFAVPFQITTPSWLTPSPDTEESNFVTWSANDSDRAVRVLLPVNVYPPGSTTPEAVPDDYVAYLDKLVADGARLDDRSTTTVDGHPTALATITTDHSIDGALGCPAAGMTAEDCFGVQPTVEARFAVIDLGDRVMLTWLRNIKGTDSTAKDEAFEQMLQSIHFQR